MRASKELVDHVTALVKQAETAMPDVREQYRRGEFHNADRVKDLEKRYRWDMFWYLLRVYPSLNDAIEGFDDSHIDTMLRRAVQPLGENK